MDSTLELYPAWFWKTCPLIDTRSAEQIWLESSNVTREQAYARWRAVPNVLYHVVEYLFREVYL